MKVILLASLLLVLLIASAVAAAPESVDQVGLGGFLPTELPAGIAFSAAWALDFMHLDARGWYGGIWMAHYDATASAQPFINEPVIVLPFTVDVGALTVGGVARSRDGKAFAHAGIGVAQASGSIGRITIEGDTMFAWEVGAGLVGKPIGAHVRYLDGGVPASTGVSAALTYCW